MRTARNATGGFGCDFIGVVSAEGVTNWPGLFQEIGCRKVEGQVEKHRIHAWLNYVFKCVGIIPATENIPFCDPWTGALGSGAYALDALISPTNPFFCLQRY